MASRERNKDDWEEYYAQEKRISERNMRDLEGHRGWHDYVKFAIGGLVAVIVAVIVS
ncbi:MAG: hypothetical protein AAGI12_14805 [Pseudomonadota bacterium]